MRFTPGVLLLVLLASNLPPVHGVLETYYTTYKCKCPRVIGNFIPLLEIERFEILPPGHGCPRTEVILWKKNKNGICLDPKAKWLPKLLKLFKNYFTPIAQASVTEKKDI